MCPGTFVYSPAAGTVLPVGTHTLRVTFTPTDLTRYTTATATQTLVVNAPPVAPVLTWAAPAAITQGTALGATQLNATANVPGTFVYSPAAGTVLAVGTHTLSVTFTPTDLTRYTTATATQTLVVNAPPVAPVLTWAAPAAITQGTAAGRDAAECDRECARHVCLQPRRGHGPRGGHAYALGHLHADRPDAVHDGHGDADAGGECAARRAGADLGGAGADYAGDGAGRRAAECHRECARHVCLQPRRGHGPPGGDAHAARHLHADRPDAVHDGDGDPDAGGERAARRARS